MSLSLVKLIGIMLALVFSLTGAAQLSPAEERAIYEKDAKEQIRHALSRKMPNGVLKRGAAATEQVATQIHAAVAGEIFGAEKLRKQQPFRAIRSGEFWVVYGSIPENTMGGTAVSVIRISNGEVLSVVHTQ